MRYARSLFIMTLLTGIGVSLTTPLYSQSLAELARKERQRKAQDTKEAKVYTNEDVGSSTPSPRPAAQEPAPDAAQPEAGAPATAAGAGGEQDQPAETDAQARAALEKEYKEKFASLREELAFEEKKLDVMQRELNLMQMQYYSDPNVAMREQYARTEINTRTQEIEEQKATVEKAKQAVADLEEELRRKGLPPGWAR